MANWKSAIRWARRAVVTLLVVVLAASAYGWYWERSEQRAFAELQLDPPGEMVRVGAQDLHVLVEGTGSPGVLFISGLGDDWRSWRQVPSRVADSTRVVSYDRPGFGWSPPRAGPLTLDAAVEDIRKLLKDTEIFQDPPILVAHSLGGTIARQFALDHPEDAAGLVLVDPTPAHAMPTALTIMSAIDYRLRALSGAVGWKRWTHYRADSGRSREQELHSAFLNANGARAREALRELQGVVESEPAGGGREALGDMPLTLLAAPVPAIPGLAGALGHMDTEKRLIAQESKRGRLVEVATNHYVHHQSPDTVVAEVLRMLSTIRREGNKGEPSG